jgi:hypothetical protein
MGPGLRPVTAWENDSIASQLNLQRRINGDFGYGSQVQR